MRLSETELAASSVSLSVTSWPSPHPYNRNPLLVSRSIAYAPINSVSLSFGNNGLIVGHDRRCCTAVVCLTGGRKSAVAWRSVKPSWYRSCDGGACLGAVWSPLACFSVISGIGLVDLDVLFGTPWKRACNSDGRYVCSILICRPCFSD